MRALRAWLHRLVNVLRPGRREREIADEIASHVQLQIDDHIRSGMTPAAARRAALIRVGGVEALKEQYREQHGIPVLEHLARDLAFAARTLRRNPTFTAVAVLTLGLGIGVNTAIFSVVNAVLLRPLPFSESNRLVLVWATNAKTGDTEDVATYPDFEDWSARSTLTDAMTAFTSRGMTLSGGAGAELVPALQVAPRFFDTLRVRPAIGRTFHADESAPGASRVAILSDSTWRRRFGGRVDILQQTIRANEETFSIVGVMPPGVTFSPAEPEQIYVPLERDPSRGHGFLFVIARLRPGATRRALQAEMDAITRQLATEYPNTNSDVGANVVPLVDALAHNVRVPLLVMLGVVTLVLLIACTNVANLLLARNASRQRELAVRSALGAGRPRLIQQLLTESALLGLAGGAAGLLLASGGTQLLVALLAGNFPSAIPRIESTRIDGPVLAFTLGLALATGIIFGVVPSLTAATPALIKGLRESSRTATASLRGRRLQGGLMIAETALALVLLSGAGLLLNSFLVMRTTPPGFDAANVLVVDVWLPASILKSPLARTTFFRSLIERVSGLPGVQSSGLVANLPLGGGWDQLGFHIPGRPDPAPRTPFRASFNIVSPGYFRTMSTPVREGREFGDQDAGSAPRVIVVNETAARQFWPGERAVGKQIVMGRDASNTLTVVGVVGDVRQMSLGTPPRPEIFLNTLQSGPDWPWRALVVKTTSHPTALAVAVASAAKSIDPNVPLARVRPLEQVVAGSLAEPRVYTALLGTFAALSLGLAAVGLFGVVSYGVTQRTAEMGIRMALGAAPRDLVGLVLGQGVGLTLVGIAIGLPLALAFARLLTRLDPNVVMVEPRTLSAVSTLMVMVALTASYLPARRGSRVDPTVTLRSE